MSPFNAGVVVDEYLFITWFSPVLCSSDQLPDESFSVFIQVLISQTLQPTFIDELTSQPGIKSVCHSCISLAARCLLSSVLFVFSVQILCVISGRVVTSN